MGIYNSRILRIKIAKFSGYYFYMNKNIQRDFQICISVPFNTNQMGTKVIISIKYGWNTIVWAKIMHLRCFCQNLLVVKVHTSFKISKFCQNFGATKAHVDKVLEFDFFCLKRQVYRYYQEKNQVGLTSSSYINLTMKLLIRL